MSKKFILLTLLVIALLSIFVECKKKDISEVEGDASEEGSSEESGHSRKKGRKSKAKAGPAIDSKELEGVWKTTFYFNHTESRVVARSCQKVSDIAWSISGAQWTQSFDSDPLYNSNGRWTIKELIHDDAINFVKIELLANSIDPIEPCIGFMRDGTKLFMMFNSTSPTTCPQKFQFFNDVCSNTVDYTVSECQSGKCLKDPNETDSQVKESSASAIGCMSLVSLLSFFSLYWL